MSEGGRILVIGSFNRAKAAEIAELLQELPVALKPVGEFAGVRPVPETGETFAENAREKALGLARQLARQGGIEAKILPKDRPRTSARSGAEPARQLSPLEKAMAVAEAALKDVPDTRDELVEDLKRRIQNGEYDVSGEEIAEMMMRRLAADRIR